MVTTVVSKDLSKGETDYTYYEFSGLSTDTKPTTGIYNGSIFFEMDTGDAYMFNGSTEAWTKL